MTSVIAIDPGPAHTAMVELLDGRPYNPYVADNEALVLLLADRKLWATDTTLAIEMIASYGMPVGKEVFETCLWIGRIIQAWGGRYELVYRKDVKLHLCNSPRANDASIRQALIDRWGGKATAIGNKSNRGPLYGFKGDLWQALAVAVTHADTRRAA